MSYPSLPPDLLLQRLQPPAGRLRLVLDTDTYNEVDDQFALAYALRSPEKLQVEAVYAAPFWNDRSNGPQDGMLKSYDEILRLLALLGLPHQGFVFKGSTHYLDGDPEPSPAALDLVARALASPDDDPLYVVAIGAITNVASALLLAPAIARKIVVVWLGGHLQCLPTTVEFNLRQDVAGARLLFDCGVPLVQVPCVGAASHLLTTRAELSEALSGRNPLCDFLFQRFCAYRQEHFAYGKELWDVAPIAWLVNESWAPSRLVPSPQLMGAWDPASGGELWFAPASGRHPMREVWFVRRNPVFQDLFTRLRAAPA